MATWLGKQPAVPPRQGGAGPGPRPPTTPSEDSPQQDDSLKSPCSRTFHVCRSSALSYTTRCDFTFQTICPARRPWALRLLPTRHCPRHVSDEGRWHQGALAEIPGLGAAAETLGFQHPPPAVPWTLPRPAPARPGARLRGAHACVPRGPAHLLVEKVLLAEVGPLLFSLLAVLRLPQHHGLLHGADGHLLRAASAKAAQPPGATAQQPARSRRVSPRGTAQPGDRPRHSPPRRR